MDTKTTEEQQEELDFVKIWKLDSFKAELKSINE